MEIERETIVEIAVSAIGVGVFVAAIVAVGAVYGGDGLTDEGGLALVGAIVLFVLFMAGVGFWLSGTYD